MTFHGLFGAEINFLFELTEERSEIHSTILCGIYEPLSWCGRMSSSAQSESIGVFDPNTNQQRLRRFQHEGLPEQAFSKEQAVSDTVCRCCLTDYLPVLSTEHRHYSGVIIIRTEPQKFIRHPKIYTVAYVSKIIYTVSKHAEKDEPV